MSKPNSIADISTPILRAMLALCPEKPGESVTFGVGMSATLTHETRARIKAELKRRWRKVK